MRITYQMLSQDLKNEVGALQRWMYNLPKTWSEIGHMDVTDEVKAEIRRSLQIHGDQRFDQIFDRMLDEINYMIEPQAIED